MTDTDALSKLPALSWRGIVFPYDGLKSDVSHRHGEHEYVMVDGARIEMTGRKARVFSCVAKFYNIGNYFYPTQYAAPWFPDVMMQFIAAMEDRSLGTLYHPTRGPLLCYPLTSSDTLEAAKRDGESVTCTWVESNEDRNQQDSPQQGAASLAQSAANAFDAALAAIDPRDIAPQGIVAIPPVSFSDLVKSIVSVADTASLVALNTRATIDSTIYQVQTLHDAVQRTGSAYTAAGNAVANSATRLQSALYESKNQSLRTGRTTKVYTTKAPMTLGQIAYQLKVKQDDLLNLNPGLVRTAIVPRNSTVTYYG